MTLESQFAGLGLAQPLLRAIADAGYTIPTPIQLKAIPLVLAGGDLLAAAQTGTGKTAGFVLPILQRLSETAAAHPATTGRPRCLILTPTRELAAQVEESVRTYGKHVPLKSMVMFGGVGIQPQIAQLTQARSTSSSRLRAGCSTTRDSAPSICRASRFSSSTKATGCSTWAFFHDIKRILALLPKKRQSMLFSATFSEEVRALANGLLVNPASIDIAPRNVPIELVEQTVHLVAKDRKRDLLSHLIRTNAWEQVLVFTRTKHGANRLTEKLEKDGIRAVAIHGNKSQGARTRALAEFKRGAVPVLVATDIASRGLDIDQLPHVVNFELPTVAEDYIHRIGRTGRAGLSGAAVSLVDPEEIQLLRAIEKLIKRPIERVAVAGFDTRKSAASATDADDDRPRARPARQQREPRGRQPEQRQWRGPHAKEAPRQHQHVVAGRDQPHANVRHHPVEPVSGEGLSEAARHQSRPQPALFSPPRQQRRRG